MAAKSKQQSGQEEQEIEFRPTRSAARKNEESKLS